MTEQTFKYVILWEQSKPTANPVDTFAPVHSVYSMHPVSEVKNETVSYSTAPGLSGAMRFGSEKAAIGVCESIRKVYGAGQNLEIIQDPPAKGGEWSQKELDKFLPAWAWFNKYGKN